MRWILLEPFTIHLKSKRKLLDNPLNCKMTFEIVPKTKKKIVNFWHGKKRFKITIVMYKRLHCIIDAKRRVAVESNEVENWMLHFNRTWLAALSDCVHTWSNGRIWFYKNTHEKIYFELWANVKLVAI